MTQSVGRYVEHPRSVASRVGATPPGGTPDGLKAKKLRLTRAQADKEETRAFKGFQRDLRLELSRVLHPFRHQLIFFLSKIYKS